MKRKTAAEPAAPFRYRHAHVETEPIRHAVEAWAAAKVEELYDAEPELPTELNDRAAEAGEPMFAIAALAEGPWPKLARAAALGLIGDDSDEPALGARLLAKLKEVFDRAGMEALTDFWTCPYRRGPLAWESDTLRRPGRALLAHRAGRGALGVPV